MSEPNNLPAFLRNPGGSYEFVSWLRRFLDDPSSFTRKLGDGIRFDVDNQGGSLRVTANTVAPGGTGILMDDKSGAPSEYRSASDLDVNAGQDINEVAVRDWNLQGGQDVNVVASRDLNMSTLVRDVNVLAKGKLSLAAKSSDVVAAASLDLSTAGAGFSILDHLGNPIVTWTG